MRYDELISACIECIKGYNPTIQGPDSYADIYLKKKTKDSIEKMFIKQVFYGVLRYKDFLKIFTEGLFEAKPSSTERKDEVLFQIFAYLTIFRLDELPIDDYKQLVLSQDCVRINELFTFLFDENVLKTQLREKWIEFYDFNYVDNKIIGGLMETKEQIQDLLSFILNKAKVGNLSSTKETSDKVEDKEKTSSGETQAKPPKPEFQFKEFNLSKPKPKLFKEPIAIENKFVMKPIPLANYKKTSLKDIEEKHKEIKEKNLKETLQKYDKLLKQNPVKFASDERPMNIEKVREEVERKIQSTLQFNNKYVNKPKDFSNIPADVRYNEAAILREEHLINKKKEEEEKELEKILVEKKDSKEYERWVEEMKAKDDILKMEKIQKRKLELEMNREIASNYMQQRIKKNQMQAMEHKKQELKNLKNRQREKAKEIKKKQELVKEIDKEKENIVKQKEKTKLDNQKLYKNQVAEYNELNLIAKEEKKIENQRRDDLIRQIKELEKLPIKRTKGYDPTETPGYGLLEEMSIAELRERLELQKKMLADEISSKREENKLKMEEKADALFAKANIIAEHRDKLRNEKEVERKNKKEAIKAKEELMRKMREKSLFEVKKKIEEKKEKLRKEDEIFQKKIREIKLQRQFLQLGRAAVEEKAFKQIEDGLERKINDRQNQDLIDQQLTEAAYWRDVKLRYNSAKSDVRKQSNLLQAYQKIYENTKDINDACLEEDTQFKKAVHDREVGLAKFQNDVLKERNKFSDKLQALSCGNKNKTKGETTKTSIVAKDKNDVIDENQENIFDEEDNNPIMNKLENEEKKSLVAA